MQVINRQKTRLELLETLPKFAVCAELGVFRGDFSEEIFKHTNPCMLYLVDTFDGVMHSGDRNGENIFAIDMREQFKKLKEQFGSRSTVAVVKGVSWNWLSSLRSGSLDWVYIDTSHNYEDTRMELSSSWEAVRLRGFICGHDYSPGFPGVMRAVNEFVELHGMPLELFSGDRLASFKLIREDKPRRD